MDRVLGIQLYIRVIETGSFSRAAADLGLTQPTATKQVAAMEERLGARLLHRSSRGVAPTEVGAAYYDKCKAIAAQLEEADNLAALMQARVRGTLRVSTSVAFGRRVLVPLALRFMQQHPELQLDLNFEDRYVNLVEQGVDLAIRMGRLADSSLGARHLGHNPWVLAAAPAYLQRAGTPDTPADLARHAALVYSSVMGDDRWTFSGPNGLVQEVPVDGPLRSNNLSAVVAACRAGLGLAALPRYVAHPSLADGSLVTVLPDWALPGQEVHAVFPSPKLVPGKVRSVIDFLSPHFQGCWWELAG
ncbi:transcriptional regulator [Burkholderiales bacterium JOSHI_001]|nr:transcriptional regulator [Burkholderiales bacterium JOSHI_001]